MVAQSKAVALEPGRQMGRTFAGLLLIIGALAAIAAIPVSARIAEPLARLTYFARNFIREQRTAPPPAGGPDEVRGLSVAVRQRIDDL